MVGIGVLMLADRGRWAGAAAAAASSIDADWFLRLCQCAAPLGFVAVHRRLGDDRGRPPALDGLRPAAHRRFRLAVADRRWTCRSRSLGYIVVYLVMFPAGLALMLRDFVAAGRSPARHAGLHRQRPAADAGRGARRAPRSEGGAMSDRRSRSRADLDADPRRRRLPLCAARRLRPRRRHPVRLRAATAVAQPDDELDRAGLGRQRDLADPRRRRRCWRPFRWPSPSSFRRSISRSC